MVFSFCLLLPLWLNISLKANCCENFHLLKTFFFLKKTARQSIAHACRKQLAKIGYFETEIEEGAAITARLKLQLDSNWLVNQQLGSKSVHNLLMCALGRARLVLQLFN